MEKKKPCVNHGHTANSNEFSKHKMNLKAHSQYDVVANVKLTLDKVLWVHLL